MNHVGPPKSKGSKGLCCKYVWCGSRYCAKRLVRNEKSSAKTLYKKLFSRSYDLNFEEPFCLIISDPRSCTSFTNDAWLPRARLIVSDSMRHRRKWRSQHVLGCMMAFVENRVGKGLVWELVGKLQAFCVFLHFKSLDTLQRTKSIQRVCFRCFNVV